MLQRPNSILGLGGPASTDTSYKTKCNDAPGSAIREPRSVRPRRAPGAPTTSLCLTRSAQRGRDTANPTDLGGISAGAAPHPQPGRPSTRGGTGPAPARPDCAPGPWVR